MPKPNRPALTPEQIRQLLVDNGLTLESVVQAVGKPAAVPEPDPVFIGKDEHAVWALADKYLRAKYPGYENMDVDWTSVQWLDGKTNGEQPGFQVNAIMCLEVPMYAYRPDLKKEKPDADA